MDAAKRFDLIRRNTAEILTEEELQKLLAAKKKPAVYLGTAITGKPHVGYFVWALKMADFLRAGFRVRLLLADLHGALDNCPWDALEKRYAYYAAVLPLLFEALGAPLKDIELVKGSSFQLSKEYMLDVLKAGSLTTVHDATKAASEVVKLGEHPKLGGILYPVMQALDEQYLDVDVQYGGIDQRKIFVFARELLPKLGYRPRVEVMTPLVPGLIGKKMSASDERSKIDLLDDEATVQKKVEGAYCEEGTVEDNGVLAFLKYVVMVLKQDHGGQLVVERPAKFGGPVSFASYDALEEAYAAKKIHPMDLKSVVAKEVNALLTPFRKRHAGLLRLAKEGYPG